MTQKDKELLLKDLCARLPYGVNVHRTYIWGGEIKEDDGNIEINDLDSFIYESVENLNKQGCTIKPYLRPMSSMTEEEGKEFNIITNGEKGFYEDEDGWVRCDNIHTKWGVWPKGCAEMIDWLNEHHFDYRGLIEKGLALEAPNGMYKTE